MINSIISIKIGMIWSVNISIKIITFFYRVFTEQQPEKGINNTIQIMKKFDLFNGWDGYSTSKVSFEITSGMSNSSYIIAFFQTCYASQRCCSMQTRSPLLFWMTSSICPLFHRVISQSKLENNSLHLHFPFGQVIEGLLITWFQYFRD